MLTLPRLGCINLHGSLLPKYRGAAPIQWAVAMGDAYTGNTTMLLEEGLDTGPILMQQTVEIGPDQTAVELFDCWPAPARRWWSRRWPASRMGPSSPNRRIMQFATFAPLLDREDGRMDFQRARRTELYNRWRGFQPWPGAFTTLDGKKLIVHRMAMAARARFCRIDVAEPGRIRSKIIGSLLPAPEYLAGIAGGSTRRQEAVERCGISARKPAGCRRAAGLTAVAALSRSACGIQDSYGRRARALALGRPAARKIGRTLSRPPTAIWSRPGSRRASLADLAGRTNQELAQETKRQARC